MVGYRLLAGLGLAVVAALVVLVGLNEPTEGSPFPRCAFHLATGWYCPGCGGTRALHLALNGDLIGAMKQNLLVVAAIPLATIAGAYLLGYTLTGRSKLPRPLSPKAMIAITIGVLLFAVIRNLSGFAFLAPSTLG